MNLKSNSIFQPLATVVIICSLLGCSPSSKEEKISTKNNPEINTTSSSDSKDSSTTVVLSEDQEKEIGLQTIEVRNGFIKKIVEATGRVAPNAELSRLVSTPSPGRATEVKAKLGDFVQPGDIMSIIKSDAVGQIQSDLLQNALQAKADIKQQEVQLKLSRITFERESKLFAEQVSAKADLQSAENQLEKDTANLAALKTKLDTIVTTAQERLKLLGATADSAAKVLATKKTDPLIVIRAPESGLVIERNINPGELNDGTKPLFTLTDLSQVWLLADVFEKDINDVKKDQEAHVCIDSLPNHKFEAQIIWVGDSINASTRTLPVRANVSNCDLLLKPGMFARIKINVGQVQVMLIPRSAIVQKGDKNLVYIDQGNRVYLQQEVETGVGDTQDIEVKSGLQLGQRVVTQGSTALLGTAMKVVEDKGD